MGQGLKIGPGLTLTPRQRAFVAEYIKTWDAEAASLAVGYTKTYGSKLVNGLVCPDVAEAIKRIQSRNEDKAILESDQILESLSNFVKSKYTDIYENGWLIVDDPKKIPEILQQFISKVDVESVSTEDEDGRVTTRHKVKLEIPDKLRAYDMLMKAQGTYAAEKVDVKHGLSWDALFASMNDQQNDQEVIDAKMKELES